MQHMNTVELDRNEVSFLLTATMQLAPVQVGQLDNLHVDQSIHNLVTKLKNFMSDETQAEVIEESTQPTPIVAEDVASAVESVPEVSEASEPVVESAPAEVVSDPNDPNYA